MTKVETEGICNQADSNLVKKSDGAGTVMIVGTHFEHITTTNESTSYYLFGGPRLRGDDGVAMRVAGAVYWLHGDHLGSASLTTSITGTKVSELRYLPFGETRWMSGTTPTDRRYTGQRELAGVGLYDYIARMYWPAACPERSRRAGRFVSADTVVPGPFSPQHYNRYLYVLGNPLRLVDPSGHVSAAQCGAITDQAQSALCWNQRWYEAHGYSWVNGGWQAGHDPIIDDAGIGMDVLGEAGITLESEAGLSWTDDMIKSAAYGVARLGGWAVCGNWWVEEPRCI